MNKTAQEKKRDITIDIIKGVGIFLMVAAHCGVPFSGFICLFHMAIFFIVSGYCYNNKKSETMQSVGKNIWNKIKTLWFPYVLWMTIFSVLHNVFIKINVYTDNELLYQYSEGEYVSTMQNWAVQDMMRNIKNALIMRGESQIGGALWFLAVLFELSVAYCIVDSILRRIVKSDWIWIAQGIVAVVLLAVGYYCHVTGTTIGGLAKMCSYYCLYYLGNLMKHYHWFDRERKPLQHGLLWLISFSVLLVGTRMGYISLANNSYGNPIFFLVMSLAGWAFLYEFAWMLKHTKNICKIVVCWGQNTLFVVLFHFLCFKLVNLAGALIYGWPLCSVAAFPILCKGGAWWMGYTAIGLLLPVFGSVVWKCGKKKISIKLFLKDNGKE